MSSVTDNDVVTNINFFMQKIHGASIQIDTLIDINTKKFKSKKIKNNYLDQIKNLYVNQEIVRNNPILSQSRIFLDNFDKFQTYIESNFEDTELFALGENFPYNEIETLNRDYIEDTVDPNANNYFSNYFSDDVYSIIINSIKQPNFECLPMFAVKITRTVSIIFFKYGENPENIVFLLCDSRKDAKIFSRHAYISKRNISK